MISSPNIKIGMIVRIGLIPQLLKAIISLSWISLPNNNMDENRIDIGTTNEVNVIIRYKISFPMTLILMPGTSKRSVKIIIRFIIIMKPNINNPSINGGVNSRMI